MSDERENEIKEFDLEGEGEESEFCSFAWDCLAVLRFSDLELDQTELSEKVERIAESVKAEFKREFTEAIESYKTGDSEEEVAIPVCGEVN